MKYIIAYHILGTFVPNLMYLSTNKAGKIDSVRKLSMLVGFKFQLYGKMNFVKKHDYKLWLNDGVYKQGRTTCFGL
jgi:hypothetical protein